MVWKKVVIFSILFIFFLPTGMIKAGDFNWNQHASLKISIKTEDSIYEWEYDNPDSFEFELGDRIVRGKEAKVSFENVLQYLDLEESTIDQQRVENIEKNLKVKVERLEIFRRDQNYYLQTWLWTKKTSP